MNGVQGKNNKESPKTPGGISKSLLTPCRRVGLSRKWRKTTKELGMLQGCAVSSPISSGNNNKNNDITSTPCRNSQIPRKKSKVLSLSLKNSQESDKEDPDTDKRLQPKKLIKLDEARNEINVIQDKTVSTKLNKSQVIEVELTTKNQEQNVSKIIRTDSKSKKLSLKKSLSKTTTKEHPKPKDTTETANPKEKSPNNLTKECIVVIQNKILKTVPHTTSNKTEKALLGSDSELDVPLSALKTKCIESVTLNTLDENDFISKPIQKKIRNLSTIKKYKTISPTESSNTSQSSQEEMDGRTILVKKTYEKVIKPHKAKSTGSITQKDIEELKARIEMKKKLLLAKSMENTGELRELIKKWQKGCQDALMELLDLMKKKLPDRQNMDYAEILETLKIPAQLVGYDSDNDCFITPDDTNTLLSTLKF